MVTAHTHGEGSHTTVGRKVVFYMELSYWKDLVGDELAAYQKFGFGQRIGFGQRPAVLVVDMTYLFVDPNMVASYGEGGWGAVRAHVPLLAAARAKGLPIFYSRRNKRTDPVDRGVIGLKWAVSQNQEWLYDPRCDEWPPEIVPQRDDVIIYKPKPSPFFETPLRSMLTYLGVDTLVITGISTSGCVRAAVQDAFSCNFRVTVPLECTFDRSKIAGRVNLFDMDMKFADVLPLQQVLGEIEQGDFWEGNPVPVRGPSRP